MSSSTLSRLQEELVALKSALTGKVKVAKSDGQVVITFCVDAPAAASNFDVDAVTIRVTLDKGAADESLSPEDRVQHVRIELPVSTELPSELRTAIAGELERHWRRDALQTGKGESLRLWSVYEHAVSSFLALVSSVPKLLEAYESTDAQGATVRRYTFEAGTGGAQAQDAAPSQAPETAVLAGARSSGVAPAAAGTAGREAAQRRAAVPVTARSSRAAQAVARATGHEAAQSQAPEIVAPAGASSSGLAREAAGTDGGKTAARQATLPLDGEAAWLRRRFGAALRIEEAASQRDSLAFALVLRPNDPDWESGRALHLQGSAGAGYPAQGSFQLAPGPGLPEQEAQLLAKLLEAEAASLAGRPDALRCLVRFVDTRAAQLLHTAGDVLFEAARRRAASPAAPRAGVSSHPAANRDASGPADAKAAAWPPTAARRSAPAAGKALMEPVLGAGLWWPAPAQLGGGAGRGASACGVGRGADPPRATVPGQSSGRKGVAAGPGAAAGSTSASCRTSQADESSWESDSSASGGSGSEGSGRGESSGAGSSAEAGQARGMGTGGRVAWGGLEVRLEGLKLDALDALEPARLTLQARRCSSHSTEKRESVTQLRQVACVRCQHAGELVLETETVAVGAQARGGSVLSEGVCTGCHQAWAFAFAPRIVHERSAVIGILTQVVGCAPVDLLPSLFVGQCGSCSAAAALRAVQVGRLAERDCSRCHSRMGVTFLSVAFVPRAQRMAPEASARAGASGADPRPAFGAHAPSVQEGQPLPNMGTCRHYRHSHRWLRFPCCGQRFPCDLCHEEGTDGHDMKWAQRMTCGYCAREQKIGEQCVACGKRLARSAAGAGTASRFWERMDRNDPHKYRNSQFKKTRSNKSSRVGCEGKKQRLQRGQKKAKPQTDP